MSKLKSHKSTLERTEDTSAPPPVTSMAQLLLSTLYFFAHTWPEEPPRSDCSRSLTEFSSLLGSAPVLSSTQKQRTHICFLYRLRDRTEWKYINCPEVSEITLDVDWGLFETEGIYFFSTDWQKTVNNIFILLFYYMAISVSGLEREI